MPHIMTGRASWKKNHRHSIARGRPNFKLHHLENGESIQWHEQKKKPAEEIFASCCSRSAAIEHHHLVVGGAAGDSPHPRWHLAYLLFQGYGCFACLKKRPTWVLCGPWDGQGPISLHLVGRHERVARQSGCIQFQRVTEADESVFSRITPWEWVALESCLEYVMDRFSSRHSLFYFISMCEVLNWWCWCVIDMNNFRCDEVEVEDSSEAELSEKGSNKD